MVMEAFITSYGLLAIASLVALTLGGLFLIDPAAGSMHVSVPLLVSTVAGIGFVLLAIGYLLSREKHRKIKDDPVVDSLAKVVTIEAGGLRGTAIVNGEIWNFESREPLAEGDQRLVGKVKGLKIFLERRI